jgi:hypothetical protein
VETGEVALTKSARDGWRAEEAAYSEGWHAVRPAGVALDRFCLFDKVCGTKDDVDFDGLAGLEDERVGILEIGEDVPPTSEVGGDEAALARPGNAVRWPSFGFELILRSRALATHECETGAKIGFEADDGAVVGAVVGDHDVMDARSMVDVGLFEAQAVLKVDRDVVGPLGKHPEVDSVAQLWGADVQGRGCRLEAWLEGGAVACVGGVGRRRCGGRR